MNNQEKSVTKFIYVCDKCHTADYWVLHTDSIKCVHCSRRFPISEKRVIQFEHKQNEQNKHFNQLYGSGYSQLTNRNIDEYETEYQASKNKVKDLLKLWRIDKLLPIEGKTFLDVACGPGWLTAGLMQQSKIFNSTFHAFDISATGLEMLATFAKTHKTAHQLELSVQDAEQMRFDENTFDFIIGHSMLHHLPEYERFLTNCHRLLKKDGVALFGEPFALGYGLLAACLKLAQNDLGTSFLEIEAFYDNIKFRVTQPRKRLKKFVDKHLFFQSEITQLVQQIGFSSVEFISFLDRDYYRNRFVENELRFSYGISDDQLIERANTIYRTFFDIFDTDRFIHAISAFMYVVLRN